MKYVKFVSKYGYEDVRYSIEDVDTIKFEKARKLFSASDMAGNGLRPNEIVTHITFKDGKESTLTAQNWEMQFE